MKFFLGIVEHRQNIRNGKNQLLEVARSLLQGYWNTSSDLYHFLISMITAKEVHILCMHEANEVQNEELSKVVDGFVTKLSELVKADYFYHSREMELTEITFDDFFYRMKKGDQIYADDKLDFRVLNIDSEQYIITEKLFDENLCYRNMEQSFIPIDELKRIESPCKSEDNINKPVHYIVHGSDRNVVNEINADLIYKLRLHKRIRSRRYVEMSRDDLNSWEGNQYRIQNFNNLNDGLVLVDLDRATEEEFQRLVETVYSEQRGYKSNYTVIFNLLSDDEDRISDIEKICSFWPFVEISDKKMDGIQAIKLLEKIAEENDVVLLSKHYEEIIKAGEEYSQEEIRDAFRMWYLNTYSIRENYPQYKKYVMEFFGNYDLSCPSLHELDSLIGLEYVKGLCKEIIAFYQMEKLRKQRHPLLRNVGMHMVFQGNPGTAKTTVARILARIFKEKGILSKGELIEVGRADLVAKYVGHTAKEVKSYFERAKGSVLFIDEAYSLADKDGQGDYGTEAINTIVQEMENNREDLVVIFAGYKKEMKDFLRSNSGLSSRITFFVDFPDYSDEELFEILKKMAGEYYYTLADDVRDVFKEYINNTVTSTGNGRLVRNAFERARIRQSSRICGMPIRQLARELFVLSGQDFGGRNE